MKTLHIGFDDTDSIKGRCTTHLSYLIANNLLKKFKAIFIDFPLLIRLNPNVPLKTRGNGAVCLRIRGKGYDRIKEELSAIIENYSDLNNGANPGIAFYEGDSIPKDLATFSKSTINTIQSKQIAEKIAIRNNMYYNTFGKGYGLVGAIASIGCCLDADHTYETIAYRKTEYLNTPRKINEFRVKKLSDESFPFTFNNFDSHSKRVLITPHGPDPVFCGIRGEDPIITTLFLKNLNINEELDGYMVFRSNQGTNSHLMEEGIVSMMLPFTSGYINCEVITKPRVINGGHVIFFVKFAFDNMMPVAVYKPTRLTQIASLLEIGDKIEIGYGIHIKANDQKTMNLEYLYIKELKETVTFRNPICDICKKTMKAEGKDKGFQCQKCKTKNMDSSKITIKIERKKICGLYIPDPIAHRHLTKPCYRYGKEKKYDKNQILNLLKNSNWIMKNSGGLI